MTDKEYSDEEFVRKHSANVSICLVDDVSYTTDYYLLKTSAGMFVNEKESAVWSEARKYLEDTVKEIQTIKDSLEYVEKSFSSDLYDYCSYNYIKKLLEENLEDALQSIKEV